jgi:integrase
MPIQRLTKKSWEIEFQRAVSSIDENCGLTVTKSKVGNVELRHRGQGFNVVKTIPFKWEENWGDAYTRIRNIFKFITEGHNLKAAAELAQGKAPKKGKDWAHILNSFEDQKTNFGNAIADKTWKKDYLPVCQMAVDVMAEKNPPTSPKDLIDRCLKDWNAGSRARQIRARSLSQFLTHAVTREGIADIWTPPSDLKEHIGRTKKGQGINQKGDPFSDDQQILDFLKTLPIDSPFKKDADAATRWNNAFCLMAELGLRPTEVNKLIIKKDPTTKEFYWFCTYEKKGGGGTTEPRRIEPLPLLDRDGKEVQWNLIDRFRANLLPLPDRVDGDACKVYLQRREGWKQLKEMMKKKEGSNLVPYSFRHYYSLRGHIAGIDSGSMASSMGHSIEAHHRAYPYSSKASTTNAFKQARERLTA